MNNLHQMEFIQGLQWGMADSLQCRMQRTLSTLTIYHLTVFLEWQNPLDIIVSWCGNLYALLTDTYDMNELL